MGYGSIISSIALCHPYANVHTLGDERLGPSYTMPSGDLTCPGMFLKGIPQQADAGRVEGHTSDPALLLCF